MTFSNLFFVENYYLFDFLNFPKCIFVFLGALGLYIDVLSTSMRFSVFFCIYEHIKKKKEFCLISFVLFFCKFRNNGAKILKLS